MSAYVDHWWRQGRKVGRTIYAQIGTQPDEADVLIGVMDSVDLARAVVADHNSTLTGTVLKRGRL